MNAPLIAAASNPIVVKMYFNCTPSVLILTNTNALQNQHAHKTTH